MRPSNWAFFVWLPLMVVAVLLGWLVFGALPNMRMTGDLIAWLMELPVTTCYAIAVGGATFLTLQVAGINIDNTTRTALMARAQAGDAAARAVLRDEAVSTIWVLMLWAVFFFPHY